MNTTDEQVLIVMCHRNGNWIPDPAEFTCLSFTTVPPGIINASWHVIVISCPLFASIMHPLNMTSMQKYYSAELHIHDYMQIKHLGIPYYYLFSLE